MYDVIISQYDYESLFDSLDVTETTRKEYVARFPLFLKWLQHTTLNNDSFLRYKQYLRDRTDLSVASKNKYLAVARTALKELHRRGLLPIDITFNVKGFGQSKKHKVNGLRNDDIEKITTYLRLLEPSKQRLRLKAILALLIYQGLRQVEIVRLNVEDVDFSNRCAYVQGKGRDDKERIFLHPETVSALESYLKAYAKAHGALFTPLTRRPTARLTTRGLRKIVQEALHCAGVNKTVHGFRHYFTTMLIKSYKGDLLRVAHYTRHSSVEMLQIYNDSIIDELDLPRFHEVFSSISLNDT